MKSVIAAFCITAAMAAASAQASSVDLSTFAVSGSGVTSTNYASVSGTSSVSGAVTGMTSFDWNFTAGDYMPYNDYSFFITTASGTVYLSNVAAVGDFGTTGWQTYTLGTPYSGVVTFGVANDQDGINPSHLEVRNVMAVPEPETYAMMLAGLAMVGAIARRRARAAA